MPSFVRRRRRTHCPVCEQTKMCGTYISRCRKGDIYMNLRQDANQIIKESINRVLPDEAVRRVLMGSDLFGKKSGRIYLVAVGKAAWQMAAAAQIILGEKITKGIVLTKYGHVRGELPGITCLEEGHPVPDDGTFRGTEAVLAMTEDLKPEDTVLFLLSGGGSALFEKPLIPKEELSDITAQLLACGADIVEMNTVRKRLSAVKGGKFALHCAPAKVFGIVLSDILGDPLDMIASGPAAPDSSTCAEALHLVEKYQLRISEAARHCLETETPKSLSNVESVISGSVTELCQAVAASCRKLGYEPVLLTDQLSCEAREVGSFLAAIAKTHCGTTKNLAFIAGGETVVHLEGSGKGGRNQELALSAAPGLAGMENAALFSIGSDGTDGPTDAAGGYVDGSTKGCLAKKGMDIYQILEDNNAYEALKACDGLIMTGPTGTNVNDVAVLLLSAASVAETESLRATQAQDSRSTESA